MASIYVGTRLYDTFRVSNIKKKFVSVRKTTFNKKIDFDEKVLLANVFWNFKLEEIQKQIGLYVKNLPEKMWDVEITE